MLQDSIDKFLGYGSLAAPTWFIGIEERGGKDVSELSARLQAC